MVTGVQIILLWVQLIVGLITLAGGAFYIGRHSRRQEENTEDIRDLSARIREVEDRVDLHDTRIALANQRLGVRGEEVV